ncbi:MAG: pitrilysin family protein [Pirellulaceae bacterium]
MSDRIQVIQEHTSREKSRNEPNFDIEEQNMTLRGMMHFVALAMLLALPAGVYGQGIEQITEIEGITEYKLDNGIPVLIFPDNSKPNFTVNMTIMVGSRHEGYGETGMAHLLEHMLFKGTERHKDIPTLLKDRGVLNMNGTTWFDRTNYYEQLPSTDENLEFAIRMEADRLLNSLIRSEDLSSEMTVVRNEFEIGENDPGSILMQRIMATAYEWHNYGKSTIGNRSDIERVPVENLREFYRKYYQPDNVMVVVAGQFDTDKALEYLNKYFGSLELPDRKLPQTYTEEPVQDGERIVSLRRVGDVQMAGLGYHMPAASHPDYAACEVLSTILGIEPSGRLYQAMVVPEIASSVNTMLIAGHDPGYLLAFAEVPKDKSLDEAREALIAAVEKVRDGVDEEEVKRAVQRMMKQWEQQFANSSQTAINLSEWYAYGSWKLFFYYRDQLEKVSAADVQRVANEYLLPSNRTVGLFIPTDEPKRANKPKTIDIASTLSDYKGRESLATGEAFEPTPENIGARTISGELKSGIKFAFLPKKTRGERVQLAGQLHFGNLDSFQNKQVAASVMGRLMSRGTTSMSFQQIRDRLDELKASMSVSSTAGSLSFSIQTKREFLPDVLDLLKQVLREPAFDEKELSVIVNEMVTSAESMLSDPQGLAMTAFSRAFNTYETSDPRYSPTLEEQIEWTKALNADDIREVYSQVGGSVGELAVVGDFDVESIESQLDGIFADWASPVVYQRIEELAPESIKGEHITIETPDKANAIYVAGQNFRMRDDDPDYEAMLIGNYILGGGPLSSRLADSVRKEKGLSYAVGSMFRSDSMDQNSLLIEFAMSAPENTSSVVDAIREEVTRLMESGVEAGELDKAKASYLETRTGSRSNDAGLAALLMENLETGRDMQFHAASDARIETLSKEQVDAALKKYIDLSQTVIITAGDFAKAKADENGDGGSDEPKETSNKDGNSGK